jgi:aldose 1-epimerase
MKPATVIAIGSSVAALSSAHAEVMREAYGQVAGQPIDIYTLRATSGLEARIMTYGAALVSLKTQDRDGQFSNVVLGFDSVEPYLAGVPYFGATVGRYANRIADATFKLEGKEYRLSKNDGPNSLHGGTEGFDKRVWKAEAMSREGSSVLRLTLVSPAGDQGYPGKLTVHVAYRLAQNSLEIDFDAKSTAPTPVNLANHAYFNLTGDPTRTILGHTLKINAERFTPINATLIPTGELRAVANTPFDFRRSYSVGERIEAADEQLKFGKGYDHNWVLARSTAHELETAATLSDPFSGRTLEIRTTQPGIQFYSGNFLDGGQSGRGTIFKYRTGLCLETQHFPDSPNQATFPSTILRPGQTYNERTLLIFGLMGKQ